MGCAHSTRRTIERESQSYRPTTIINRDDELTPEEYSQRKFDDHAIDLLRHDFYENFEMFLLNNLLMSVMFYKNFEEEIRPMMTVTEREHDLHDILIKEHSKQCVMPDILYDNVNRRVHFVRRHGPKKGVAEPLIPTRMYIVHDKIEILRESEDLEHYTGIDKPTQGVNVQDSSHPGYVKLKLPPMSMSIEHSDSAYSLSSSSSTYAQGQAVLSNGYNQSQPSNSSSDSEESDYMKINKARTEAPIRITEKRNDSVGLPPGSIIPVKTKNLERLNDEDDMFKIDRYVNSEVFMKYFRETDFPGDLAKCLGFSQEEIKYATYTATSIFCNSFDISKEVDVRCEILPAVKNPFPNLNRYLFRERQSVYHKEMNRIYVFPTKAMLNEISQHSSIIVPRGFLPKRGENKEYHFEWETVFPKTERYIQLRMTHAQIRCYLFLAIIHKAFIEPITQHKGLVIDHLRNLLLWECEENYKTWPEHRMGNKLLKVLKNLESRLSKRNMPYYFIETKDMFCNIPNGHLLKAQEQICRMMENPIPYAISALRNVRYADKSFYPELDFDKLYKMLTQKGEAEKATAPGAVRTIRPQFISMRIDRSNLTKEQLWELQRMEKQKERKRKKEKENQKATNLNEEKRKSVDSVDLQFTTSPIFVRDSPLRQKSFLIFFMEHYLRIIECSHKYEAWNQYEIYLSQVRYMNALLRSFDPQESLNYDRKIDAATEIMAEQRPYVPSTPTIPPRNSVALSGHTEVLMMNQPSIVINMSNVNRSYQMGSRGPRERDQPLPSPTKKKDVRLVVPVDVHNVQ